MSKFRVSLVLAVVVVLVLLIAAPAVASAAPAPAPDSSNLAWSGCWYRVRWGDNLSNIAWRHGTTATHLARINGLCNPDRIFAGQWLKVPCFHRTTCVRCCVTHCW